MMRSKIIRSISFWILLIALWQIIYIIGVDVMGTWKSYAVPSPQGVVETFIKLIKDNTLLVALVKSMRRVLIGFGISIIIGVILGMLMTRFRYLDENLKPMILGLQTLPSICWVPFAILWYGLSESAILFVIIIGSTFSIAMSVEGAIKGVNPLYLRAAKTMGAKGSDLYTKVIFPASLPAFITGLKQGWSFSWRALMSGEMMSATLGLGQVLSMGRDLADINQVMVVMLVIVLVGTLIERCVFYNLEKRVNRKMGLDKK